MSGLSRRRSSLSLYSQWCRARQHSMAGSSVRSSLQSLRRFCPSVFGTGYFLATGSLALVWSPLCICALSLRFRPMIEQLRASQRRKSASISCWRILAGRSSPSGAFARIVCQSIGLTAAVKARIGCRALQTVAALVDPWFAASALCGRRFRLNPGPTQRPEKREQWLSGQVLMSSFSQLGVLSGAVGSERARSAGRDAEFVVPSRRPLAFSRRKSGPSRLGPRCCRDPGQMLAGSEAHRRASTLLRSLLALLFER